MCERSSLLPDKCNHCWIMIQTQAGMASVYQRKQYAARTTTQLQERITGSVSHFHPEWEIFHVEQVVSVVKPGQHISLQRA